MRSVRRRVTPAAPDPVWGRVELDPAPGQVASGSAMARAVAVAARVAAAAAPRDRVAAR